VRSPADRIPLEECNRYRIPIFLDACVIINAIRRGQTAALINRIDPSLRHIASVTLYEVAFAHEGHASTTLKDNQAWIQDHRIKRVPWTQRAGRRFDQFLAEDASKIRGKGIDLGDVMLACWAKAFASLERVRVAIATENHRHFKHLSVLLVEDFLPTDSA
jgi:predicted nucleic acid-binding protein